MTDRKGRFPALFLITILVVAAFLLLIGAPEDANASDEPPTRATKYYLGQTFTMNYDWNTDDLWVVVFAQSADEYRGTDVGDNTKFYNYMEVGNSLMFPIDGNLHNSGNVRRPLVELFTATDCFYCPSAEESLDTVHQERGTNEFSLIEWHRALEPGSDPYETGSSGNRFNRYNVTGTPTVIFDGQMGRSGGDSSVNSPQLVRAYNNAIDRYSVYDPYVALSGSASTNGGQCSFNVSFEVIDALPKGTWTLYAVIVEDLQKEHNGATMRHTQRRTFTKGFPDLQADHPTITLDEESTYSGINVNKVMGDMDIYWDASDPQDGSSLDIDIIYAKPGQAWETLVEDIPNTGSYTWDTETVEDSKYLIRMIAEDSAGNRVMSAGRYVLTVNNPDLPEIELIHPMEGDSLKAGAVVNWTSYDDEDIITDLLVNISISMDSGSTWEVITYNQVTGTDFIPNEDQYIFNTLVWPDLDTYKLMIQIMDRDGMITEIISDVFEIYNNDEPIATLFTPEADQVVTGTLEISWKVQDEEDEAWGVVDQMIGNFSVLKKGEEEWITLFLDNLDVDMEDKSFPTSELDGDGEYTLRFTVTDTRGKSDLAERNFMVYDPDKPQFNGPVEGPQDTSDLKSDTLKITWTARDPDADEILTFSIEISPVEQENWTLLDDEVTESSYDLDLTSLEQGRYKLRITAVDDSPQKLSTVIEYGPFYYNAPDAPILTWLFPGTGFNGTIEDDLGIANETGFFNIGLIWSGTDPEGDNITYSLYWKTETAIDWKLLEKNMDSNAYIWNVTSFTDGSYMLRIVAKDASDKHLTTEVILGPFSIDIPWDPPVGDDDDVIGDDDVVTDDGVDLRVVIGIAVGSVIFVILLVVVILVILSKTTGKKPDETPVIPTHQDVDLSIPDIGSPYPQQAVYSGQIVSQGPYAGIQQQPLEQAQETLPTPDDAPVQPVPGQVPLEGGEQTPEAEPQPVPSQEQIAQEPVLEQPVPQEPVPQQVNPEVQAPMDPPPAIPEIPQPPPPMPPQE